MGHYYTAEVCENGHHTTADVERSPEMRSPFCPECGKKTFTNCTGCDTRIRGEYDVPGVAIISTWYPSNYCHNCGRPYPWTEMRLSAAQELADELEELNEEERKVLKQSIPDLSTDTPRTELATMRYQNIVKKIGETTAPILNQIVSSVATEAVKKALGL